MFGRFTEYNWFDHKEFYESKKFVAWPSADYFSCELLPTLWSFSLERAKFEKTQVSVNKYENGKKIPLKIKIQSFDGNYGLNTIVWGIEDNWNKNTEAI